MKTLRDYELGACLLTNAQYSEFAATDLGSRQSVRLVQFSESLSGQDVFRAEFRKDLPTLQALKHFHILRVLDSGESNGRLFYTTECPEGDRLSANKLSQLAWDQVIDLAWQLSSAVQHAHNVGISHGNLSHECVFVSPGMRIQISAFGIQPWADVTAGIDADEVSRHEADSRQIAAIINSLVDLVAASQQQQLKSLASLLNAVQTDPQKLTARDIQRRLGKMLLRDSDSEIELIDERAGQAVNRRSLVDELFDDLPANALSKSATSQDDTQSPLARIVCLMALLTLLALGIWCVMR